MSGLWKQYGWLGSLFFTLCLSFFVAKIVGVYLASLLEVPRSIALIAETDRAAESPVVEDLEAYAAIKERNIFDASDAPTPEPCKPGDERPECQTQAAQTLSGEPVKTSLPIKVLSTVVVGDGKDGRSTAVVDAGGGKGIDVYAVRDPEKTFGTGVVLIQIKPRRIEFLNNNRLEFAEIVDDSTLASIFVAPEELKDGATAGAAAPSAGDAVPTGEKVAQVSEGKYVVDQGEIDAALTNLDQLYTQIRAVPNFEAGKVQGMKILSIKPGSIFAKLGLQRGDVLDRINGQQIDIKNGFQLFNQLKEQKQFSLDLKRGGKTESFEYEIR